MFGAKTASSKRIQAAKPSALQRIWQGNVPQSDVVTDKQAGPNSPLACPPVAGASTFIIKQGKQIHALMLQCVDSRMRCVEDPSRNLMVQLARRLVGTSRCGVRSAQRADTTISEICFGNRPGRRFARASENRGFVCPENGRTVTDRNVWHPKLNVTDVLEAGTINTCTHGERTPFRGCRLP